MTTRVLRGLGAFSACQPFLHVATHPRYKEQQNGDRSVGEASTGAGSVGEKSRVAFRVCDYISYFTDAHNARARSFREGNNGMNYYDREEFDLLIPGNITLLRNDHIPGNSLGLQVYTHHIVGGELLSSKSRRRLYLKKLLFGMALTIVDIQKYLLQIQPSPCEFTLQKWVEYLICTQKAIDRLGFLTRTVDDRYSQFYKAVTHLNAAQTCQAFKDSLSREEYLDWRMAVITLEKDLTLPNFKLVYANVERSETLIKAAFEGVDTAIDGGFLREGARSLKRAESPSPSTPPRKRIHAVVLPHRVNDPPADGAPTPSPTRGHSVWEFAGPMPPIIKELAERRDAVLTEYDQLARTYKDPMSCEELRNTTFEKLKSISNMFLFHRIFHFRELRLKDENELFVRDLVTQRHTEAKYNEIAAPASMLLAALRKLDAEKLLQLGIVAREFGTNGVLQKVSEWSASTAPSPPEFNLFDDEHTSDEALPHSEKYVPGATDFSHEDVVYIVDLLRTCHEAVDDRLSALASTERQGDVVCMSRLFRVYYRVFDRHFGEAVSRASRYRRRQSIEGSAVAEGYHVDWLFCRRDASEDKSWGSERGLCERVGAKAENVFKGNAITLKIAKTLRDQREALMRNIASAGNESFHEDTLQASRKLAMVGFTTSAWLVNPVMLLYVGAGFYACWEMDAVECPVDMDRVNHLVQAAELMLKLKRAEKKPEKKAGGRQKGSSRKTNGSPTPGPRSRNT
ncbi:hypothetical protein BC832DRAFT_616580 [Gaertneriomyces semiglobifer]|nr:hypothetical protein BC832DRAFT_616580 [Gaertneriomyces semiglobifer]